MTPHQWNRSSYCSTGACLESRYTRSTRCEAGACVEVRCRCQEGTVQVRDSKLSESPVLTFGLEPWRAFIDAVKGAGL